MTHARPAYSVYVRGVTLSFDFRVLLLLNERNEWELPGGRLELGETPEQCVVREIAEESGWQTVPGPLLDVWSHEPEPGRSVLTITYGCPALTPHAEPVLSDEHQRLGLFSPNELHRMHMYEGYRRSVTTWLKAAPTARTRPVVPFTHHGTEPCRRLGHVMCCSLE
ncbi:NUDIX hydrolase [Streptomyces sp. S.PB5]|uniref:NUDIX hydrolase n=1 Tax=Streptomyces sp. S.PB5 TaxID=3020844 RepID=UPI0025AED24C|nr:NUDIX hydrolase [Streptomyces sp. S.PB5]MDN3026038.1 NUDIX hydrolase [Streptomyces sp. S.PB5]